MSHCNSNNNEVEILMIAACKDFLSLSQSLFIYLMNTIIYGGCGLLKVMPSDYAEQTLKAGLDDGKFMSTSSDYMLYA